MTAPLPVPPRCAVHPARPAVDVCPVCNRDRCGADAAQAVGGGCRACRGDPGGAPPSHPPRGVPAGPLERLVRAGLAAYTVGILGGIVASEYVGATVFSYLGPFVVGVVCGGAALKAAGTDGRGRFGARVRGIGALYALLGVALSFVDEQSQHVLSLRLDVLGGYAAAIAGALLWTMPPRQRRAGQGRLTDV